MDMLETLKESSLIDARALHTALGVKARFADWVKYKIVQHDLGKDEDYWVRISKGRAKEYSLTFRAAMQIVMAESSEKAVEIKDQLITEGEKQAQALKALSKVEINFEEGPLTVLDGEAYLLSTKVAELTGKRHDHVLKDIEVEMAKVNQISDETAPRSFGGPLQTVSEHDLTILSACSRILEGIRETVYTDAQGKLRKAYLLNEAAAHQILMKYSTRHRLLMGYYFTKMREALKKLYKVSALNEALPETRGKRQYVYIIRDPRDDYIKIGVATNPQERLAALQTGNYSELVLEYTSPICSNAFDIESKVHEKFEDFHVKGEWFDVSIDDAIHFLQRNKYVLESSTDFSQSAKLNEILALYQSS